MKFDKEKFWQYSYSDFIDNRNRAALGEFIVARALGISDTLLVRAVLNKSSG